MAACAPSFHLYSTEYFLGRPGCVLQKPPQTGHTNEDVDIAGNSMRKA